METGLNIDCLKVRVLCDPSVVSDLLDQSEQDDSGAWVGACPEYGRYAVLDQALGSWVVISDL